MSFLSPLAFTLFVVIFCGGLVAVTVGMFLITLALIRRHRRKS